MLLCISRLVTLENGIFINVLHYFEVLKLSEITWKKQNLTQGVMHYDLLLSLDQEHISLTKITRVTKDHE